MSCRSSEFNNFTGDIIYHTWESFARSWEMEEKEAKQERKPGYLQSVTS